MIGKKKAAKMNHRHRRLLLILTLLVMLTVVAVVLSGIFIFNCTTRDYREQILQSTSKLAAEQIDGDKVNGWFENGLDDAYESTARALERIINHTPFIQYLYVYQIREDGCHVVFDFDTSDDELTKYDELPDVDSDSFGVVIGFDESFADYIPTLLAGGRVDMIESNDTYGWLLTQY